MSGCHHCRWSASADRRDSPPATVRQAPDSAVPRLPERGSETCPAVRGSSRRSPAFPLSAIARSTVAEAPVFSTSRITRVEEGPTWGILRSAPSGWRYDSSGAGSSAMASAARWYPHLLCFEACTAARSRSRPTTTLFVSMTGFRRAISRLWTDPMHVTLNARQASNSQKSAVDSRALRRRSGVALARFGSSRVNSRIRLHRRSRSLATSGLDSTSNARSGRRGRPKRSSPYGKGLRCPVRV